MKGSTAAGGFLLAVGIAAALCAEAQPQGPWGGGRGGGGARLRMFVPVEQTIGFLAFDEQMGLTDDQLVKARNELKGVHARRAELMQEMQGGDRQAMMEKVQGLRREMLEKLKAVLDDRQGKLLDDYLKRMQDAFQRGGGRRGGPRGGPPGDGTE